MPLRILGSRVDAVSLQGALDQIRASLGSPRPHHVITGNTLMLLDAEKDAELRAILEKADLVTPESSGIRWASRVMGEPILDVIPGIDMMLAACRIASEDGRAIYLLGSSPGVAESASWVLKERYPALRVVGTHHGYFQRTDDPSVVSLVKKAKPSLLLVGMGMPMQEKWIAKYLLELGVPVVMGVGGSFDVLSGKLKRAPAWMRRLGIEWAYRLLQEPWRWRRIARLPVFAGKVLLETGKRRTQNKELKSA